MVGVQPSGASGDSHPKSQALTISFTRLVFVVCSLSGGRGCPSSIVASLSFRKSSTNRYSPGFFLGTGKEGLLHGLTPGSIFPSSKILSVSLIHAALLSPWIWNIRCFTGTAS